MTHEAATNAIAASTAAAQAALSAPVEHVDQLTLCRVQLSIERERNLALQIAMVQRDRLDVLRAAGLDVEAGDVVNPETGAIRRAPKPAPLAVVAPPAEATE